MIDCKSKEIYVICGATDMRKGINGLATIASLHLAGSSFESAMFVFCNKKTYPKFFSALPPALTLSDC